MRRLCLVVPDLPRARACGRSQQILVPLFCPFRPNIAASAFSTELVLERSWTDMLSTKYLLFPVHVSLAFMRTSTLASAMYLLLLRWLHRDYVAAQRLIPAIATDAVFSTEEQVIMGQLAVLRDFHPDAHATRMHITLALVDAPLEVRAAVTWDLPDEVSASAWPRWDGHGHGNEDHDDSPYRRLGSWISMPRSVAA
jgi:hypothetical protein